ncbi:hypothetical protein BDV98DRAFT_581640 [Pterulicium gracile]|uniref:Thaumatin n=1 Tax=Pterulicium gracile TaxID=1884261 RepID=A0A5C3QPM3_9AGAR|nr:hypothetical protein BDV98DRAFT_581640 [Pterula gracilis]
MQLPSILALAFVIFASFTQVLGFHEIRFRNNCATKRFTPRWKAGFSGTSSGPSLAPQTTWSSFVPEKWVAGRAWGDDDKCNNADGTGCTLFECTFSNFGYNSTTSPLCLASIASSPQVGMSFSWINSGAGCQGGKRCSTASCLDTGGWLPPDSCNGCLSQCNTGGVDMLVTFCP